MYLPLTDHAGARPRAFGTIRNLHPARLAALLREESPEVFAAVLAELEPSAAADTLRHVPNAVAAAVLILLQEPRDPSLELAEIECRIVLRHLAGGAVAAGPRDQRFMKGVVEHLGTSRIDALLTEVAAQSEVVAVLLRRVAPSAGPAADDLFALMPRLPTHDVAQVARTVSLSVLAEATLGASQAEVDAILASVSPRVAESLREEQEVIVSRGRFSPERARAEVALAMHDLERSGSIVLPKVPDLTEAGTQPTMAEPI